MHPGSHDVTASLLRSNETKNKKQQQQAASKIQEGGEGWFQGMHSFLAIIGAYLASQDGEQRR